MTRHARSPSTQRQTVSAITRSAPTEHPDSVAPGAGMWSVTARTCQPSTRSKSSREGPVAHVLSFKREALPGKPQDLSLKPKALQVSPEDLSLKPKALQA